MIVVGGEVIPLPSTLRAVTHVLLLSLRHLPLMLPFRANVSRRIRRPSKVISSTPVHNAINL